MKNVIFLFVSMMMCIFMAEAQTVKTVGNTGADYATLKLAFDAINAGTISGNIELRIIASTTETAIASLAASGSGSASYTAVAVYPTASGLTIIGSAPLTGAVVELVGAKNVTFDGRVNRTGTVADLTIQHSFAGND